MGRIVNAGSGLLMGEKRRKIPGKTKILWIKYEKMTILTCKNAENSGKWP